MLVYGEVPLPRTFRIIRPSKRRTAKQNATRWFRAYAKRNARHGLPADAGITDVHTATYDGCLCFVFNYYGSNPRTRVKLERERRYEAPVSN